MSGKIKNSRKILPPIFLVIVVMVFLGLGNFAKAQYSVEDDMAGAVSPISMKDRANILMADIGNGIAKAGNLAKEAWDKGQKLLETAGSKALNSAIRSTLNTIAYDTATYLATGAPGQKSLFYKEDWGTFMYNVADNAVGSFLDRLGKEGLSGKSFNLCNPDASITMRIGLGIKAYARPTTPNCTWTNLSKSWKSSYDRLTSMQSSDFLQKFQNMFEPTSNDLGIALSVHSMLLNYTTGELDKNSKNRTESQGWNVFDTISSKRSGPPNQSAIEAEQVSKMNYDHIGEYTGDALADAANVFVNQFALSLFNKLMRNLADNVSDVTSPYDFTDSDSAATYSGIAGAKEAFRKIVQPKFNERGDYEILAELTNCPNPTKAGPTECVLTENFRKAISENMTVAEAIDAGYLNGNGIFGFNSDGLEPDYSAENYPFRQIMILRKYRILPVSWEVAAELLKANLSTVGAVTLQEVITAKGIDPNWVLKAPQNYCKREGPGPEIASKDVSGEGEDSKLSISRKDNYCADEQSCVKEDASGVCKAYGYCTLEKPVWKFDAQSCEPINNTCETFSKTAGGTVSYLKNGLDYGECDAGSAGCNAYCTEYGNFDATLKTFTSTCTATTGAKLNMNSQAEECDAENEGCHEFIRLKAGLGANLLPDASFEDPAAWSGVSVLPASTLSVAAYNGVNVAKGSINKVFTVGDSAYSIANQSYTLSFWARDCVASDSVKLSGGGVEVTKALNADTDWTFYSVTNNFLKLTTATNLNQVVVTVNSSSCLIDAIKLEAGEVATAWSDYRGAGLIYQKLKPGYLTDALCNGLNPPAECKDFVNRCQSDDVGCQWYTAAKDDMTVPAKVTNTDYCPKECVGYDKYFQTLTAFDSARTSNMIPDKEKACSADAAGCDQFTNLDKLGSGAEAIEYYSQLRHCIKSGDPSCAEFYTWEGSSESGYQLKVFSLKNNVDQPAVTSSDSAECTSEIYHLPATDPAYNSDCREFYNKAGVISYHLYTRTISCSDNCHPYRRTEMNFDPNLAEASCPSTDTMVWDSANKQCNTCLDGGKLNDEKTACVYDAVPGEGLKCTAAQSGCREYTGSEGANMRVIVNDDFEGGDTSGWAGGSLDTGNSLIAGGHSLSVASEATLALGSLLKKGKSYSLSFIVKGSGGAVAVGIRPATGAVIPFSATVMPTTDWQLVTVNLEKLDNAAGDYEASDTDNLFLSSGSSFNADNIKLTEITDRYYLVKHDPWNISETCYSDVFGVYQGTEYNLGCEAYSTEENGDAYLRQFTKLCSDAVVGCEAMIDTQNSIAAGAVPYNKVIPTVNVPADEFSYVVYDEDKQCNQADKGCQRLGLPDRYQSAVIYSDVYLKNDPDKYDSTLCSATQDGCQSWTNSQGQAVYFKDPNNQVCEYRQPKAYSVEDNSFAWYKKAVKKCDTNLNNTIDLSEDKYCSKNYDCSTSGTMSCILDGIDRKCPMAYDKTFGSGGIGNEVMQPTFGTSDPYYWAGLCPASESGCNEYIDPLSKAAINEVFNPDCQNLDGSGTTGSDCDGWSGANQTVKLYNRTLYTLNFGSNTGSIQCSNWLRKLNNNNVLEPSVTSLAVPADQSMLFYVDNDSGSITECTVTRSALNSNVASLRAVMTDYQKGVSLSNDCNGNVDYDNSCVLFDQRTVGNGLSSSGSFYDANNWDADTVLTTKLPSSNPTLDHNDSNVVLKVRPDRRCDQWLGCQSFSKDGDNNNVCYGIGLCNRFDENGNCANFLRTEQANQSMNTWDGKTKLMSGYTLAGNASTYGTDKFPMAAMEQVGQYADPGNGSFEVADSNKYPLGWTTSNASWDVGMFSVINNPISAQTEGINYPIDGKNIFKFSPSSGVAYSEFIDVIPGKEYVVSADLNSINFHPGTGFKWVAGGVFLAGTYGVNGEWVYSASHPGGAFDIEESTGQAEPWKYGFSLAINGGKDWTKFSKLFRVGPNTHKIKLNISGAAWWLNGVTDTTCAPSGQCSGEAGVKLADWCQGGILSDKELSKDTCSGNIYVDNLQLRPALNERDITPAVKGDKFFQYLQQTCRLYPKTDSLSCQYSEDSGAIQKGWYGYCLQYDRYPGDPNNCLMWYPVDNVIGDGFDEGAGYLGKYPVYYCKEATMNRVLEYRKSVFIRTLPDEWYNGWCGGGFSTPSPGPPTGYANVSVDSTNCYWGPSISGCYYDCTVSGPNISGWYDYDGFVDLGSPIIDPAGTIRTSDFGESTHGLKFYNDSTKELSDTAFAYCTNIVKTVTELGQNKFWSSRVNEGSDYVISFGNPEPEKGYRYTTDEAPFGSIVPPTGIVNPYDWDGSDMSGTQPLQVRTSGARASHPYKFTDSVNAYAIGRVGMCENSGNLCYHLNDGTYNNADCPSGDTCNTSFNFTGSDPKTLISGLFAQSYGNWVWNGSHYIIDPNQDWGPGSVAYTLPTIENEKINSVSTSITSPLVVLDNQFANLTFNSVVNPNQLPLVMYAIEWGDGKDTTVSGVEMRDRLNADNPHSLYHLYSYWDMKAKAGPSLNSCSPPDYKVCVSCSDESCTATIRTRIMDNWGVCSGDGYTCNAWQESAWITVKRKD